MTLTLNRDARILGTSSGGVEAVQPMNRPTAATLRDGASADAIVLPGVNGRACPGLRPKGAPLSVGRFFDHPGGIRPRVTNGETNHVLGQSYPHTCALSWGHDHLHRDAGGRVRGDQADVRPAIAELQRPVAAPESRSRPLGGVCHPHPFGGRNAGNELHPAQPGGCMALQDRDQPRQTGGAGGPCGSTSAKRRMCSTATSGCGTRGDVEESPPVARANSTTAMRI